MKRVLMVIVLVGIVAGAGAYFYMYQPFAKVVRPAELLPEETLLVVEATDAKKSLDDFRTGPLGRAITGIDWVELMRVFEAPPEEIARFRQLQAEWSEGVDSPAFETVFGNEVTLAVLKPVLDEMDPSAEQLYSESVLMVVRPKQPAEMVQWVGKTFAKDATITTETYGKVEMDKMVVENGEPLYIATDRGLGLIALDPAPILRCLDPVGNSPSVLADNPDYQQFMTELTASGNPRFFSYINLHQTLDAFLNAAARFEPDDPSIKELEQIWGEFNRAKPVMGAVYTDDGQEIHSRCLIRFDPKELPPHLARLLDIPPQKNDTLNRMPEEVLYYGWQNNFNKILKSSLDSPSLTAEEKAKIKRQFEHETGISFDDAVNAFGNQFALVIEDIATSGLFPVPKVALMVQMNRPEILDQLAENAMQDFRLPLETKNENGIRIRHVILPYGEDVSPGYACTDGFCIISSNLPLLKTLLFKQGSGKKLTDAPLFKRVDKGLSDPNNQMVYIHSGKWIAKAKMLVKWGLSFAMMSGKTQDARQLKYLADKVIDPLLDGLSMYQVVGLRSFLEKGQVQSDLYIGKSAEE